MKQEPLFKDEVGVDGKSRLQYLADMYAGLAISEAAGRCSFGEIYPTLFVMAKIANDIQSDVSLQLGRWQAQREATARSGKRRGRPSGASRQGRSGKVGRTKRKGSK